MEREIKINTLIAQYMGYEIIPYNGDECKTIYNGNKFAESIGQQKKLWGGLDLTFTGRFTECVRYPFLTDFNYLIPVIKKIEESGYVVAIKGISYQVYKVLDEKNPIVSLVCGDLSKKTECTCELITWFIEHQNKEAHGL